MKNKEEREKKLTEELEKIDERLVKLLLMRIKVASIKELLMPYDERYKKSYDPPNRELSDKARKLAQAYWEKISKGDLKNFIPETLYGVFLTVWKAIPLQFL